MLICLFVLLILEWVHAQEVALIVGGVDETGKNVIQTEVYTGHLDVIDLHAQECLANLKLGDSLPHTIGGGGIFVPDHGIILCGGGLLTSVGVQKDLCLSKGKDENGYIRTNWSPLPDLPPEWSDITASINISIQFDATTIKDESGSLDLMLYGPTNRYLLGSSVKSMNTYILGFSGSEPTAWSEGILHSNTSVKWKPSLIKWELHHLRNKTDVYVEVLPGNPVFFKVHFCPKDSHCQSDEWMWKLYYTNNINCHGRFNTMAVLRTNDENLLLLKSTLESNEQAALHCNFKISATSWDELKLGPNITFTPITDSEAVDPSSVAVWTSLNQQVIEVGSNYGSPNNCKRVHKYVLDKDKWNELPELKYPRCKGHTVIPVPISWLCDNTTLTTTTTEASSTTEAAETRFCQRTDSRGLMWRARYGTFATKDCPDGLNANDGKAKWFCDANLGDFNSTQPNRMECIATWVEDIQNMINKPDISSNEVIVEINGRLGESFQNTTGGTILSLSGLLGELLSRDEDDKKNRVPRTDKEFTRNFVNVSNLMFSSYLGWTEITDSNQKQSSITNNLGNLDYAGYLLAEDWGNTHREHFESLEQTFEFDKVSMKVLSIYDTDEAPKRCFQFNTKGSLCVKYLTENDDFHTYVSTLVKTKENSNEQDSLIFPRFSTDAYKSGGALGDQILGLTINNDADDLKDLQTIIVFQHDSIIEQVDGCQFVPGSPQCIYWDLKSNDWSNLGCEVTSHTDTEVVCTCNHLTNFGLMLDWSGQADSQDPVLSALSTFLLIISMISLILTEVLLFLNKKDTRNLLRRTAESNRNICLFIAQLCFVAFVGSNKSFSCGICEAMGAVTHFAWLAFFSWMFVEGYFFYTALVIVFEMTRKRLWLFYVLTYGVSLIIVLITVTINETTGSYLYLRRDSENTVNSCWLHSYAIIAVLVPVGLVVAFNIGITILAVKVADKAGRRREQKSKQRIISTFRNTILISLLLGLTWTIGFLPYSVAQQYITVILNASMGIYILAYSILANTKVRTDIKERVTEMMTRSTAPQPSPTTERTQQEVNKPINIHSNSNSFSRNSFSDTKL